MLRHLDRDHPDYPAPLRALPRPPAALWVKGQLPEATQPLAAIVGSRAASGQGCSLARQWASRLARAGWGVVSGGALGIDAAAHEGALEAGAGTYAVLGCGVDVVYPDRHGPLFGRIASTGGLISEHPPGTPPRPGQFPVRNRLIVALARVVVVVEARLRSGALVTARLAQQQGRHLLAVPGTSGTDALLQAGLAWPVADEDQLFAALEGRRAPHPHAPAVPEALLPLLRAIRAGMHTPATIALYLGHSLSDVMASLTEAEMEGWVRRGSGSHYEVIHGH